MKKNFPVTGRERSYGPDVRIISLTDTKGIITHVNQDFVDISGYSREELLDQNHNIVRHPDMPPEAFADLWNTIKQGKPWIGIVKNRCKNGDHYWVNAYATPVFEGGKVAGYQSVRTRPRQEWVERADKLYKQLLSGKAPSFKWPALSVRAQYFSGLMSLVLSMVALGVYGGVAWPLAVTALALGAALSWGISWRLTRRLLKVSEQAKAVFHNDVALQVYGSAPDEIGQIELVLAALEARRTTIISRMGDAASGLVAVGRDTLATAEATCDDVERQRMSLESVATAAKQIAASINEVSESAARAAHASEEADEEARQGQALVHQVNESIAVMVNSIGAAATAVQSLHERSAAIVGLVDVIRSVAEQTNLLALNAAIEAARAGEHGRGFAVVADEVRNLATRTQESTVEIEKVIEQLRLGVESAVQLMARDHEKAQQSIEQAQRANLALDAIVRSAATIADMSSQIAAATEEQTTVIGELGGNLEEISEVAESTSRAMASNLAASRELERTAQALGSTVTQFR